MVFLQEVYSAMRKTRKKKIAIFQQIVVNLGWLILVEAAVQAHCTMGLDGEWVTFVQKQK